MTPEPSWKIWQKISFRFFFLFLGISTFMGWNLIFFFAVAIFFKSPSFDFGKIFNFLTKPFSWLDKHIYHTGYDPKIHLGVPGDNHFGIIFYFTLLAAVIIATAVWSILDKHRPNYNKLFYWFNIYLRYVLAMIMFGYGIDKFIPIQMSYPSAVDLLTPLGEQGRFSVLWNFMGLSPGFMMFTGACEIIGSLLLFSGRTALAGSLFLLTILCNVVAFNFFYNIPVKLFSSLLLTYVLFLLAPYFYKLVQLFFYRKQVAFAETGYKFLANWKKYLLRLIMILVPFFILLFTTLGVIRRYNKNQVNARRQKIYEVVSFISKDTLPPLLTDTLRWKRFLFAYTDYAIIYNMNDKQSWYKCDADSIKKTFTLLDDADKSVKHIFHYAHPQQDQLMLTGEWKGNNVSILMKSIPIDSMPLNKEKMVLIQE